MRKIVVKEYNHKAKEILDEYFNAYIKTLKRIHKNGSQVSRTQLLFSALIAFKVDPNEYFDLLKSEVLIKWEGILTPLTFGFIFLIVNLLTSLIRIAMRNIFRTKSIELLEHVPNKKTKEPYWIELFDAEVYSALASISHSIDEMEKRQTKSGKITATDRLYLIDAKDSLEVALDQFQRLGNMKRLLQREEGQHSEFSLLKITEAKKSASELLQRIQDLWNESNELVNSYGVTHFQTLRTKLAKTEAIVSRGFEMS